MKYAYELKMKVRDYECDLEGIVNNANYQHYMEHTRHEFLLEAGLSFAEMHNRGIDAVVARITIRYKTPLRSRDEFLSCLNVKQEGLRYVFYQDIYRLPDMKLAAVISQSGFTSESTFFCTFKAVAGMSPKEWLTIHGN